MTEKSHKRIMLYICIMFLMVFIVLVSQLVFHDSITKNYNVILRNETMQSARQQAQNVRHSMELQMMGMEGVADYLSDNAAGSDAVTKEILSSFLTSNELAAVAYTDAKGNILDKVSFKGDILTGNIADRDYFQQAISWIDARAINYIEETPFANEPRLVYAVPIVSNNAVKGVFFASTESSFLAKKVWFYPSDYADSYLVDRNGIIISENPETGLRNAGQGIYDILTAEDTGITSMKKAVEGETESSFELRTMSSEGSVQFAAVSPVGMGGLSVVSVEKESLSGNDFDTMKSLARSTDIITFLFAIFCLSMFLVFAYLNRRQMKNAEGYAESLGKLRSIVKGSGAAFYDFNIRDLSLSTSEKITEMLGYTLPTDWFKRINERKTEHPEFDYQTILDLYNKVLSTSSYQETIVPFKHAKLGQRWLKVTMSEMLDRFGEITGIGGTVMDVTEKQVNKSRRREEQRHIQREKASFIPLSLSIDLTKNTYSLFSRMSVLGNIDEQESTYDGLLSAAKQLIPEEHRSEFGECFSRERLLELGKNGGTTVELEHPLAAEGQKESGWMLTKLNFIRNKEDTDIRAVMVMIDITHRREMEDLVQRKYDLTIETMPGYVCKWVFKNDDLYLEDANSSFYRFMRTDELHAKNRPMINSFTKEEKQQILSRFRKQVQVRGNIQYVGKGAKADGEIFWMAVNGSFFGLEEGNPAYLCVITDITGLVNMQRRSRVDAEELHTTARMSNAVVMKYDIFERKLHVISNAGYSHVSTLEGHGPEYAMEKGLVPLASGSTFYSALYDAEQGSRNGKIRFITGSEEELLWFDGSYSTVFDQNGKPMSAIIMLQEDTLSDVTSAMVCGNEECSGENCRKMILTDLTRDSIVFETECDELFLMEEGITSLSKAVERAVESGVIAAEYRKQFAEFFDARRLRELFASGVNRESTISAFQFEDKGRREARITVLLQRDEFNGDLWASFLLNGSETCLSETAAELPVPREKTAPMRGRKREVTIRAFGYFDVLVDGRPIAFTHDKPKEMLAVLVDRRGGFVSGTEMISYLWEDEDSNKTTQARCRQVASRLKKTLDEYGIGDIIETVNNKRRIIPEKVTCDYFSYCDDRAENQHLYNGSYMTNYSWAEITAAGLENEFNYKD